MKDFKAGDKVQLLDVEYRDYYDQKYIELDKLQVDKEYIVKQVFTEHNGIYISLEDSFYRHLEHIFTRVDHFKDTVDVDIRGVVSIHAPHTVDSFQESFLEWVEAHDWSFGGGCKEYNENDSE